MLQTTTHSNMHDELRDFLDSGNEVYNTIALCKNELDVLGTFKQFYESGSLLSLSATSVTIYAWLIAVMEDQPQLLKELWNCISSLAALHAFLAISSAQLNGNTKVFDIYGQLFNEHWQRCVKELTDLFGESLIMPLREQLH